jgi:hypothetical protein
MKIVANAKIKNLARRINVDSKEVIKMLERKSQKIIAIPITITLEV